MNVHLVLHQTRNLGQDVICVNHLGLPFLASRSRDGLEPSRVADTNEGRSCRSPAACFSLALRTASTPKALRAMHTSTTTAELSAAVRGLRRHQRQARSGNVTRRAWIGSPLSQRRRSAASSAEPA